MAGDVPRRHAAISLHCARAPRESDRHPRSRSRSCSSVRSQMSLRVVVEVGQVSEAIDVADGEAVLVGRNPEPAKLGALGAGGLRTVSVASPRHRESSRRAPRRRHDHGRRHRQPQRSAAATPGDRVDVYLRRALHVRARAVSAGDDTPPRVRRTRRGSIATTPPRHRRGISTWFGGLGAGARDRVCLRRRLARRSSAGRLPSRTAIRSRSCRRAPSTVVERDARGAVALRQLAERDLHVGRRRGEAHPHAGRSGARIARSSRAKRGPAALTGRRLGQDGLARSYHRYCGAAARSSRRTARCRARAAACGAVGAEQGAFTGAVRRNVGAVEAPRRDAVSSTRSARWRPECSCSRSSIAASTSAWAADTQQLAIRLVRDGSARRDDPRRVSRRSLVSARRTGRARRAARPPRGHRSVARALGRARRRRARARARSCLVGNFRELAAFAMRGRATPRTHRSTRRRVARCSTRSRPRRAAVGVVPACGARREARSRAPRGTRRPRFTPTWATRSNVGTTSRKYHERYVKPSCSRS